MNSLWYYIARLFFRSLSPYISIHLHELCMLLDKSVNSIYYSLCGRAKDYAQSSGGSKEVEVTYSGHSPEVRVYLLKT